MVCEEGCQNENRETSSNAPGDKFWWPALGWEQQCQASLALASCPGGVFESAVARAAPDPLPQLNALIAPEEEHK